VEACRAALELNCFEPPHQPLGRATTNGVSDQTRQLCHPARLSRIGFDHLIGLISKSPTIA
jgi:hypothetical protein